MTRYKLDDHSSILRREKDFLFVNTSSSALGPTSSTEYLGLSLEGDVNHAPEVKDAHNSTPTPPICPEGMMLNTNNF
jgi:hypothetical protein